MLHILASIDGGTCKEKMINELKGNDDFDNSKKINEKNKLEVVGSSPTTLV
jgi:hypothetical protein